MFQGEVRFKVKVIDIDNGIAHDLVDLLALVINDIPGRTAASAPWHDVNIPGHSDRDSTR